MRILERYLPYDLLEAIKEHGAVNEIRLKRNSGIVLKKDERYLILDKVTDDSVFDEIIDNLLEHSYHSKQSQVIEGYLSLGDGYRAGIVGRAVLRDGALTNVNEIDSVNIRIPYFVKGVSEAVVNHLKERSFETGVLIYSPPGIGKTTLLRDLIIRLCNAPIYKRVSVIDTRNEIYHPCMNSLPLLDLYSGYPKEKGIECAIRTMAPDVIICDEIGNDRETDAILANQSAGVPIIATAHGSDCNELIRRKNIKRMDESGVFGCYIGIKRKQNCRGYIFDFTERKYGI
ncbi:MAG: Flp pilus assembly complex ATPase component TadA [Clostridia bacterium]|nr:Flp pilus assembly complex ATPase component TadA [Clostridia bacterium]